MGKKSTPSAPAAPDPVATANAQAQANTQAAITQANLNRVDQYTPQGSLTYQQIGTNSDGTPKYQQTQQYSAAEQQKYDQNNQIAIQLNNLAGQNISRVQDAQSKPFSYDGMTPMATGVQAGQMQYGVANPQAQTSTGYNAPVRSGYDAGGAIQSSFGTGGPLQSNVQAGAVQNQIQGAGGVQNNVQSGPIQGSVQGGGDITRNVQGGTYNTQIAGAGDVTRNVQAGTVQSGLNFGSAFNPGDFNQAAQNAANASYSQATSRLDPQFQQQQSDLGARLANSGIAVGSEAYNREMDNFARQRTDAYNQANYSAQAAGLAAQQQGYQQALATRGQNANEITTAGQFANSAQAQQFAQGQQNAALNNAAQGQLFGQNAAQAQFGNDALTSQFNMGLQNAGLNNAAQSQQFNQNLQQGNFANAAQGQQFAQGQQNAALYNSAQGQIFGQNAAQQQAFNAAQQQQFTQGQQNAALNNSAQGQQYQQNLGAAQFGNQAQQQQNTQNAQAAQFYNQGQDQGYQQALANAGLYNQGIGQNFNQGQQNAALNNTAQNQAFNQNLTNANLQNAARQQQISEATYLRNLPLNEIAALLGTGTQVQNPNFQNVAQVGVAAPDYQGAVYNNYNAAMQQYNQAQQNKASGLGSIFGLAGSLGAAAISDRRLKHNIKRVGTLANGIATYVFSYVGETARQFGVMAQEVLGVVPEAVMIGDDGYMAVDYGKVY